MARSTGAAYYHPSRIDGPLHLPAVAIPSPRPITAPPPANEPNTGKHCNSHQYLMGGGRLGATQPTRSRCRRPGRFDHCSAPRSCQSVVNFGCQSPSARWWRRRPTPGHVPTSGTCVGGVRWRTARATAATATARAAFVSPHPPTAPTAPTVPTCRRSIFCNYIG